jgi:hypothetical protein
MLKINKYPYGLVLGALAPILGIVLYYYLKVGPDVLSLSDFIEYFFRNKALLTAVGSLSLIVNIVFFTIFINGKHDKTAIGIFIMTVMYGLMILYAKFFM